MENTTRNHSTYAQPVQECKECGEYLLPNEVTDHICFYCKELEQNRRYRQHNHITE